MQTPNVSPNYKSTTNQLQTFLGEGLQGLLGLLGLRGLLRLPCNDSDMEFPAHYNLTV